MLEESSESLEQIKTIQTEGRKLSSLQIENRMIQIAKADSVINGVYYLNITQTT